MTKRTRVLMISKASIVGIYQSKLAYIAQQGIDLCVIVPPSWKDNRGTMQLEKATVSGYQMKVLPIRFNGRYHLHFYRGLARQMREFRPDIVHIDEEPYSVVTWQALWNAQRCKSKTLFFSWQNINRQYPPPFRWGERWVMNNVDYAIVGTESAGQVWREKGYSGPMCVIPPFGTEPDLFTLRQGRTQGPFTIGYIGRLVEEKGVHHLLEAVSKLNFDWRLRLLGGGPLLNEFREQATRLNIADKVQFDGQVPSTEVPAYYQKLDVLVLPSLTRPNWKEQFGRVLVEAMASGVPVIGSDSGAIPDVIGDAGLIFPEGDSHALSEQMTRLYQDHALYQNLQKRGRARFLTHFTQEDIAHATVQVYQELMAK